MLLRPAEQGAGSNSTPGQSGRPAHSPLGGRPSLVRWQIGVPDPRPCCFPEICSRTLSCRCAQQSEAPAQTPAQGSQVGLRFPAERGAGSDSRPGQSGRPAHSPRGGRPSLVRWRIDVPDPRLCCSPGLCRQTMSCRCAQQSEAPARILHQGSQVGLRTRPAAAGRRLFGGESTCRTPASAAPQASAIRTLSCRSAQQSEAPAQTPAQGSQVGLRFRKAAADPDLFGVESGCLTSASIATTCSAAGLCRAAAPSRARRRLGFYTRAVR